jgi:DNA-binding NarL/FixJ family response regulator
MRVLVADDHQLLRQALRRAFDDAGWEVVAEAADGAEAVRLAAEHTPDVVVMDVTMPVLDGIEATRRVRAVAPASAVVILTMHGEEAMRRDAVRAGASGFLTKDVAMGDLVRAVEHVVAGDTGLSRELASAMLDATSPQPDAAAPTTPTPSGSPLTRREIEVLQLIADGSSTIEVADQLFISTKTIHVYPHHTG